MQVVNLGDKIKEEVKQKTSSSSVKKDESVIKSVIDGITQQSKNIATGAKEFASHPKTQDLDKDEELFLILCAGIVIGVIGSHIL